MKTGVKIGIGVAALLLINKAVGFVRKAKDLQNNISVAISFKNATLKGLTPYVTFSITITNLSGINITIKNLFSKIFMVTAKGPVEVSFSNVLPSLTLSTGASTTFDSTFQISGLTTLINMLKTTELKVITYYDFMQQRLEYPTSINVQAIAQKVKSSVGLGQVQDLYLQPNGTYKSLV